MNGEEEVRGQRSTGQLLGQLFLVLLGSQEEVWKMKAGCWKVVLQNVMKRVLYGGGLGVLLVGGSAMNGGKS